MRRGDIFEMHATKTVEMILDISDGICCLYTRSSPHPFVHFPSWSLVFRHGEAQEGSLPSLLLTAGKDIQGQFKSIRNFKTNE